MSHQQSNTDTPMTDAFLKFHGRNPQVYRVLVQVARQWMAAGKGPAAIALFYERARWELSLSIEGDGMFRLSQNHRAFYSRALMVCNPDLAGLFRLKPAPEADQWAAQLRRDIAARAA